MSSPRHKMVVLTSPQPNELEQKKKRQTLERVKASHLSKQLQMRLQYAKLKVEHGWQRQNLNEVENLYFHLSHLRSVRQGHATPGLGHRPLHDAADALAHSPTPDPPVGHGPSPKDGPGSVSPPPSEHPDGQSQTYPPHQAPVPVALSPTHRPPSAFDLSDPNILARLAQLQAQMPPHPQAPLSSRPLPPTMTIPPTPTSTSAPQPVPAALPVPVPVPVPVSIPGPALSSAAFSPHVPPPPLTHHPHPGPAIPYSTYPPHPFIGAPAGSLPLYPIPIPASTSAPHNPTPTPAIGASQSPVPTLPATTPSVPILTPQAHIAPTALTYDSFWSTHASSSGPTRALYRTHTGFTASATPAGNVAMLTPGGHAAVMTAEGVYVGGATSKSS